MDLGNNVIKKIGNMILTVECEQIIPSKITLVLISNALLTLKNLIYNKASFHIEKNKN